MKASVENESRLVILLSIVDLSGSASKQMVLDNIEQNHYLKIRPEDFQDRKSRKEEIWRNNLAFVRQHLVEDGLLDGSADDLWRITPIGYEWLEQQCADAIGADDTQLSRLTLAALNRMREVAATLREPVDLNSREQGAGFGYRQLNKTVEKAAIDAVRKHYEEHGWQVLSRERERIGYDLKCTKGRLEEHVEVKGISGSLEAFMITAGEVSRSQQDLSFVLYLVTSAITDKPLLRRYTAAEFQAQFRLDPIGFRASKIK